MGVTKWPGGEVITTSLNDLVGWGRKYSAWPMPFATACCGIEYMSTMASHYDQGRFGWERPSFSPRQADLMIVIGTISIKQAPVLKRIYEQMAEPKYVIAMGACASCGGMFDTYSVIQGVDTLFPVDVYVPGCPPRPETLIMAYTKLQEKIQKEGFRTDNDFKEVYE